MNYEHALPIVAYLQNEIDYIPWKAAFKNFDFIFNRFKPNVKFIFKVKSLVNESIFNYNIENLDQKFGSKLLNTVYK